MSHVIRRSLLSLPVILCAHAALLLAQTSPAQAPTAAPTPQPTARALDVSYYFPPAAFYPAERSRNEGALSTFAFVLHAMGETPLSDAPADGNFFSVRMTWVLFPSSTMIVARLDIKPDGTGSLTTQVGTGPGHREMTDSVSAAEVDKFLALLAVPDFWTDASAEKLPAGTRVVDGSDWLLEAVGNNGHHAIFRMNWDGAPGPYTDVAHYLTKDFTRLGNSEITTVNSTAKPAAPAP
jgi:hypothetical protein